MAETQKIEFSLLQTIRQYEQIRELLGRMEQGVGTADSAELEEFSQALLELHNQAMHLDQLLLGLVQGKTIEAASLQTLFTKRKHLLKEILDLNESIAAKASGVKSLIAHEMAKLRSGLSAMNGYRQQQNNQGRIVNSTS